MTLVYPQKVVLYQVGDLVEVSQLVAVYWLFTEHL